MAERSETHARDRWDEILPAFTPRRRSRRIQRVVGWPARRLLDPRLEGLRNHAQWVAATIGERIDARASELGARIDGLAERVQPAPIESTESERSAVLPYVLSAAGDADTGRHHLRRRRDPGGNFDRARLLGYEVVTTPLPERSTGPCGSHSG